MRRIVYTRRMILTQTKRFIIQNGFRNVTARNLATYMEMSTQPIYKQFDSIQGLQKELVEEYFQKLGHDFANQGLPRGNTLEDFALYFVVRSQKEYPWFTQLFLTKKRDDDVSASIRQCSFELFKRLGGIPCKQEPGALERIHEHYLALLIGLVVWAKQQERQLSDEELRLLLQAHLAPVMTVTAAVEK